MRDDEQDDRPSRRHKSFFSGSQMVYLLIFLLGVAVGAVLTNQYIDPTLNASVFVEKDSLAAKNAELDNQADSYFSCLQKFGVDPNTCERETS